MTEISNGDNWRERLLILVHGFRVQSMIAWPRGLGQNMMAGT